MKNEKTLFEKIKELESEFITTYEYARAIRADITTLKINLKQKSLSSDQCEVLFNDISLRNKNITITK